MKGKGQENKGEGRTNHEKDNDRRRIEAKKGDDKKQGKDNEGKLDRKDGEKVVKVCR